jgi:hypothetical protein
MPRISIKTDDLIKLKRLVNQYCTDENLEFNKEIKEELFNEAMDLLTRISKQYTFVCTPTKKE